VLHAGSMGETQSGEFLDPSPDHCKGHGSITIKKKKIWKKKGERAKPACICGVWYYFILLLSILVYEVAAYVGAFKKSFGILSNLDNLLTDRMACCVAYMDSQPYIVGSG